MTMIPPPIMSALKIQVNHIIMDNARKTSWTIAATPDSLTKAPLTLKEDAVERINGDDGISKKMNEIMNTASTSEKLRLTEDGNVEFAKMVDKINVTAYSAGGISGFDSLMFETEKNPKTKRYWFSEEDRSQFKTVQDCKIFEKMGVTQFKGNVDDEGQVNNYVQTVVNDKATWSILLNEYSKAIERLIKKILIFINNIIDLAALAIRAVLTLLKIMEESFEYTSSVFQTVITVGGPTSQTSIITA